jgi:hypothetical protein
MLVYLYDVVKPLKSIFFSFLHKQQKTYSQKICTQVSVNNTLSFKQKFP